MEAFSLLKFWKSSAVAAGGLVAPLPAGESTILAAVSDDDPDEGAAGDDGPFFDLEFTGADSEDEEDGEKSVAELVCVDGGGEVEVVEESEAEDVVKFRVSSSGGSSSERTDPNLPVSSSEDIFKLMAVESGSDPNSAKPQFFPVSLVRSATRLRILMSGFKKSSRSGQAQSDPKQSQQKKKLFTIKFKPGEVPIVSLFTRDHSSRPANGVVSSFSSSASTSSSSSSSSTSLKPNGNSEQQAPAPAASDERRNPKDAVQKYFKKVKPLYIRVSKRYGEKLGFSGQLNLGSKSPAPEKQPEKPPTKSPSTEKQAEKPTAKSPEEEEAGKESEKKMQGSLGVGLKVMMRKRLAGKPKSAEARVVHPAAPAAAGRQRDDSLIQQQEWIQGAILHCKKSLNASRGDGSASVLLRSASEPAHEKTVGEVKVNGCPHAQNDVVGGR